MLLRSETGTRVSWVCAGGWVEELSDVYSKMSASRGSSLPGSLPLNVSAPVSLISTLLSCYSPASSSTTAVFSLPRAPTARFCPHFFFSRTFRSCFALNVSFLPSASLCFSTRADGERLRRDIERASVARVRTPACLPRCHSLY